MAEVSQEKDAERRLSRLPRYLPVALVVLLGLALSLAGYRAIAIWEESKVRNEFQRQSSAIAAVLERGIQENIDVLETLSDFYYARGTVTRQEFNAFVERPLARQPEIQALEWIPQVLQAERSALEDALRNEGFSEFVITERGPGDKMVPAAVREVYYPVYFVRPSAGNERALGFDLGSDETRRVALELARDGGEAVATARVTLVQETEEQPGFLVFLPVYRPGAKPDGVAARRARLLGFVLGAFRVGELIESELESSVDPVEVDFYVYDKNAPEEDRFIYFHPSRLRSTAAQSLPEGQLWEGLFAQESIQVAERDWTLVFKPIPGSFEPLRVMSWGALLAGLLLTVTLAAYIFSTLQRASRMERQVGERTAALSGANRELETQAIERQEAQTALRDSEARLKAIFDNSPVAIYLKTVEGRYIAVNRQYELENNVVSEEIRGKTTYDIYPEAFARTLTHYDREALEAGHAIRLELVEELPEGNRTYLVTKFLLRDAEDNVTAIGGVEVDITSLKEAERFARDSEERIRGIVDTVVDGIITIDAKGRIETFNPAAEEIFGYRAAEVLGQNVKMLMPEPYHSEHDGYLTRYLVTGERKIIGKGREVRGKRKNGQVFPLDLAISELDSGGKKTFTGIIRDVSERKRAAEQLRRYTAALEQSNQELQQFARVASHDLREPLRKIQTFGELLESSNDQELSAESQDYLARMVNAAERMQILVDDLFDFALVTQRARPFEVLDLTEIVREVLSDLEVQIEDSRAEIELHDLPEIDADPRQMRQLFQNLIGNALKFRHKDIVPKIDISARLVSEPQENSNESDALTESCEIVVADNGIGFDEKYGQQIFEVFQRLHGRSTYPGSGIGLATCRKIAEYHGGWISATSEPDAGATFVVRLPLRQDREDNELEAGTEESLTGHG